MDAWQQNIHPYKGEDDADKPNDREPRRMLTFPVQPEAKVEVDRIDDPGD